MYGDAEFAPVKATCVKINDYLAIKLDLMTPGNVKVSMNNYVKSMIEDFPETIEHSSYPWNDNLLKLNDKTAKLSKQNQEIFHKSVAKGLFLCKQGQPNIQTAIVAFLTAHVQSPVKTMIGLSQRKWWVSSKKPKMISCVMDR